MKAINGFSGKIISAMFNGGEILRGQTYPITLIMKENGIPINVDGYQLEIVFDTMASCSKGSATLSIDIPVGDAAAGEFKGYVLNNHTSILKPGEVYIAVRYITANMLPFTSDMAQCLVHDPISEEDYLA